MKDNFICLWQTQRNEENVKSLKDLNTTILVPYWTIGQLNASFKPTLDMSDAIRLQNLSIVIKTRVPEGAESKQKRIATIGIVTGWLL